MKYIVLTFTFCSFKISLPPNAEISLRVHQIAPLEGTQWNTTAQVPWADSSLQTAALNIDRELVEEFVTAY